VTLCVILDISIRMDGCMLIEHRIDIIDIEEKDQGCPGWLNQQLLEPAKEKMCQLRNFFLVFETHHLTDKAALMAVKLGQRGLACWPIKRLTTYCRQPEAEQG
jgi:hypothetical protein